MDEKSHGKSVLIIENTSSKVEETKEFKNSYFYNVYRQAFAVVEGIIDQNLERHMKEKRSYLPVYNIVPFMGKRGSGKTSAMMSFAASLEKYYEESKKNKDDLFYEFRGKGCGQRSRDLKVEFTCLECVDGSLLEKKEDIFKIILAQMYGLFLKSDQYGRPREKSYEYEKRELLQMFDKVYRSACKLEMENQSETYYEESPLSSLTSLSSSLTIKSEFAELIQRYLQILRLEDRNYARDDRERFLVVIIDDLDLNINNGYEMLEKIHRYMMVDNIIVLLSVDYDQIKLLCEKSFYRMVPQYDLKLREKGGYIERLAKDFLDKVMPANTRIFMPSFQKTEVQVWRKNGEENEDGAKEIVFKKLYDKSGMRLDIGGTKRHFYEQNSLRAYVNFFLMLDEMQKLDGSITEKEIFKHNYKILMSDILIRMPDERLNYEYRRKFEKLVDSSLPHCIRNLYIEMLSRDDDSKTKTLKELLDNLEFYGYSYGEVLRIIYCWGRVSSENKELVRCLLAFYSLEFIGLFHDYRIGDKEKARKCFVETINGAAVGSWANKMLPEIRDGETLYRWGARKEVALEKELFKVRLNGFFFERGHLVWEESKKEEIQKIVRSILVLCMFFEQPYYKTEKSFEWNLLRGARAEENVEKLQAIGDDAAIVPYEIWLRNQSGQGGFNVFSFVSNAFQYDATIKPLINNIYRILFGVPEGNEQEFSEKLDIENEFRDWLQEFHGFALPLYDIDLMYNLMKRVRQRDMKKDKIGAGKAMESLDSLYRFIAQKLQENDQWYRERGAKVSSFQAAFVQCPYIRWILERKKLLVTDFDEMFKEMLQMVLSTGKAAEAREDVEFRGYDD